MPFIPQLLVIWYFNPHLLYLVRFMHFFRLVKVIMTSLCQSMDGKIFFSPQTPVSHICMIFSVFRYPKYFSEGIPYKTIYFLQYLSIVFASALWVCVDTINVGLLLHHNVMLKILGERIAKLGWTRKSRARGNTNDVHDQLCEHVEYHLSISR